MGYILYLLGYMHVTSFNNLIVKMSMHKTYLCFFFHIIESLKTSTCSFMTRKFGKCHISHMYDHIKRVTTVFSQTNAAVPRYPCIPSLPPTEQQFSPDDPTPWRHTHNAAVLPLLLNVHIRLQRGARFAWRSDRMRLDIEGWRLRYLQN